MGAAEGGAEEPSGRSSRLSNGTASVDARSPRLSEARSPGSSPRLSKQRSASKEQLGARKEQLGRLIQQGQNASAALDQRYGARQLGRAGLQGAAAAGVVSISGGQMIDGRARLPALTSLRKIEAPPLGDVRLPAVGHETSLRMSDGGISTRRHAARQHDRDRVGRDRQSRSTQSRNMQSHDVPRQAGRSSPTFLTSTSLPALPTRLSSTPSPPPPDSTEAGDKPLLRAMQPLSARHHSMAQLEAYPRRQQRALLCHMRRVQRAAQLDGWIGSEPAFRAKYGGPPEPLETPENVRARTAHG